MLDESWSNFGRSLPKKSSKLLWAICTVRCHLVITNRQKFIKKSEIELFVKLSLVRIFHFVQFQIDECWTKVGLNSDHYQKNRQNDNGRFAQFACHLAITNRQKFIKKSENRTIRQTFASQNSPFRPNFKLPNVGRN